MRIVLVVVPAAFVRCAALALRRTFPVIVFGVLGVAAAPESMATDPDGGMAAGDTMGYMHGATKKAPEVAMQNVPKAEGADARTVAEVNTDRIALNGRPVTVRGQVVKVTNVLGKNWVHLRDGTGSGADGTDDLTVTSAAEPKIGDVVVAKGTVKADVDIGSGYAFKVLVEDATFLEK